MGPTNDTSRVSGRALTFVKMGSGLLAAVCAGLLVMSAVAMVQEAPDRTH